MKAKFKGPNMQRHIKDFFKIHHGTRISITGKDLRNLGLVPGPAYQKVFRKVLNARLNGLVKTKKEELGLVRKIIRR